MDYIFPVVVLVAGVIIAARITQWVNWFTFGQNREKVNPPEKETGKKG